MCGNSQPVAVSFVTLQAESTHLQESQRMSFFETARELLVKLLAAFWEVVSEPLTRVLHTNVAAVALAIAWGFLPLYFRGLRRGKRHSWLCGEKRGFHLG